ncbi:MAG TPA: hypothetical protein VGN26_09170 [Armatimonadota bacterium]|jgi:hypothetical protein
MKLPRFLRSLFRRRRYLCDSCRYDHPSACRMPYRPNATVCEDYVRRGERKETVSKPPNLKL